MHAGPCLKLGVGETSISLLGQEPLHWLALRDASHEVREAEQCLDGGRSATSDVTQHLACDGLFLRRRDGLVGRVFKLDLELGELQVELSARVVDFTGGQMSIPLAKAATEHGGGCLA